jgi:hypothetical protein
MFSFVRSRSRGASRTPKHTTFVVTPISGATREGCVTRGGYPWILFCITGLFRRFRVYFFGYYELFGGSPGVVLGGFGRFWAFEGILLGGNIPLCWEYVFYDERREFHFTQSCNNSRINIKPNHSVYRKPETRDATRGGHAPPHAHLRV